MKFDLNIEELSASRRRLHFSIAAKEVKKELDSAYSHWQKRMKIKGFRKGKVPRWLLEKRVGEQVNSDVANRLVQQAFQNADVPHVMVGRPQIEEIGEIKKNTKLDFTIGIDIQPEITVSDYEGLEVEYEAREVSTEELDLAIQARLQSKSRIEDAPEDAEVGESDFVLISLKITAGEEELVDEKGTMINLKQEQFYPGIEPLVIGMKKGETKTESVTIGESSVFEHLRGKEGTADITIQSVQRYIVPELNDDLAKELGYEGGVEEMKVAVGDELLNSRKNAARDESRVKILQQLVKTNEFEVPEGMVQEQLKALMEELKMRRVHGGEDARKIQFSQEEVQNLQSRAMFAAKAACILAAIARQESIKVDEADIEGKIAEVAAIQGQTVEAIKAYIQSEKAEEVLGERILEEKTLNWIFDRANLVAPSAEEAEEPEKNEEESSAE